MRHGGDIYNNSVNFDFSVSLNPYVTDELKTVMGEAAAESAVENLERGFTNETEAE